MAEVRVHFYGTPIEVTDYRIVLPASVASTEVSDIEEGMLMAAWFVWAALQVGRVEAAAVVVDDLFVVGVTVTEGGFRHIITPAYEAHMDAVDPTWRLTTFGPSLN